jgi:hypothetical protein
MTFVGITSLAHGEQPQLALGKFYIYILIDEGDDDGKDEGMGRLQTVFTY